MSSQVRPHNIHDVKPDRDAGRRLAVSVVVPTYNRGALLARTLESLAAQSPESPKFDVHVGDDGSDEDIQAVVENISGLDVHYHRRARDRFGAGQARNLAASAAGGDIVVFLDSDCVVGPDFIAGHAAWHAGGGKTVLIGGRTRAVMGSEDDLADYRKRLRRRTAGLQHGSEIFRAFVTANVSLPMALFRQVGGFDERFHRWGGEDTELGWRLWSAGAVFLDDETVSVTHQIQEDFSGGEAGRRQAHRLNMGLIASLIPHRFYRKKPPDTIPETPKVSVLLHDVAPGTSHETWVALLGQPRTDFELIVAAPVDDEEPLAGASVGDPRLRFVSSLEEAVDTARGEYLCFLDGHGAPSIGLLTEITRRLDKRPMMVSATVGYALPGGASVRSRNGARDVDMAWESAMPMCWFIRNREAVLLRDAGCPVADMWNRAQEWDMHLHWPSAAVRLPGMTSTVRPRGFTHRSARRQELATDVITRKRSLTEAAVVYYRSRRHPQDEQPSASGMVGRETSEPPTARYIGWSGHFNLGDEVMLQSIRSLLPWADVITTGDPGQLLILGGGTLINRSSYLKQITDRDSPRVERVVIGTGVANPDYWGEQEDPERWVRWLSTCAYVGVRGPLSHDRLRSWGYTGELEVSGDSALMIERPEDAPLVPGRVVISPAWTKGRLWGGRDENVVEALGSAVASWRDEGREVVALAMSPDDDGQILQVSAHAGTTFLPFVQGYVDQKKALETIASADLVVGERLHACVLAAAVGTPFVALEYRPKLRDFAASVSAEHLVMRTDDLADGDLLERCREAIEQGPEEVSRHVARYRERLISASRVIERAVTA